MQCVNHEKQIVLALHNYHDINGSLPPPYTWDAAGKPLHSWRVLILPYLEGQALYQQIRLDEPWDSAHNRAFHDIQIPLFRCPSVPNSTDATLNCSYSLVIGEGTAFPERRAMKFSDLKDALGNIAILVERRDLVCWMNPGVEIPLVQAQRGVADKREDEYPVGSYHSGMVNIGFADGTIRHVANTVPPETLRAMYLHYPPGQVPPAAAIALENRPKPPSVPFANSSVPSKLKPPQDLFPGGEPRTHVPISERRPTPGLPLSQTEGNQPNGNGQEVVSGAEGTGAASSAAPSGIGSSGTSTRPVPLSALEMRQRHEEAIKRMDEEAQAQAEASRKRAEESRQRAEEIRLRFEANRKASEERLKNLPRPPFGGPNR